MSFWSVLRHPRRYLDLLDAWKRLKKNWRNPNMEKLRQREFWMPMAMAMIMMLNDVFSLGMAEKTIEWAAGMVAVAVLGLVGRKIAVARSNGPK